MGSRNPIANPHCFIKYIVKLPKYKTYGIKPYFTVVFAIDTTVDTLCFVSALSFILQISVSTLQCHRLSKSPSYICFDWTLERF